MAEIRFKDILAGSICWLPSSLKKVIYRLAGYKIGKNVKLGAFSIITCKTARIEDHVEIAPFVLVKVKHLELGKNSLLGAFTWVIGKGSFKMGKLSRFTSPFSYVNVADDVTIGDYTGIGSHSILYTHGVQLPYTEGYPRKYAPIQIGNKVWINGNVTVLPGVKIGDNSIVLSGSVVTSSIPKDSFAAGNPCRVIAPIDRIKKKVTEEEFNSKIQEIVSNFQKIYNTRKVVAVLEPNKIGVSQLPTGSVIIGSNFENKQLLTKVSWFDLSKRKCSIKNRLSKKFRNFLKSYGEVFEEV